VTQEPEGDDVEELAREIRRIIESNRVFLERVNDEDYEDEDEESDREKEPEPGADDYEEL
jgi:uncharacterized protein YwgA